ncbi:unnamed protein product [Prorocentrum cordatum]|uniref:Chlorophyll a-b binding protein, chloroplastic n=1 Tax=Prorocentrum cordatum TaxID=2364126 RepID=A0ABN9VLE0_9DINO|nr:unnamed protein product [Polarella glacialis]
MASRALAMLGCTSGAAAFVAPGGPQPAPALRAAATPPPAPAAPPAAAAAAGPWAAAPLAGVGAGLAAAAGRRRAARRARGGAFDPSEQVGATAPLGYWDPAGFCSDGKEETFDDLRGKELKHGRVAMMAIIGFLGTGAGWRFPWTEGVPDGVAALQNGGGPFLGIFFLIFGFFELKIMDDLEKGNKPGNFGDPFKMASTGLLGGYDENWRNFELNNSRMAMIGVIGTIVASAYTNLDVYAQWQGGKEASIAFLKLTLPYSPPRRRSAPPPRRRRRRRRGAAAAAAAAGPWAAAPLAGVGAGLAAAAGRRRAARRARGGAFDPSEQVGATAPLGYWDPAGFCSDGKDRRRVAMMAIIGFLGTGAGWRFPWTEGVPDGVAALQNGGGPFLGIFFLIFGFFELKIMDDLEKGNKPGNFGDPFKMASTGLLGGYDENWRNFELNNSRMAMIGVIGTIVASAYTNLDVYAQWQGGKEASIAFLKLTLPYSP